MSSLRQRDPRERKGDYCAWVARAPCIACLSLNGRVNTAVHIAHLRLASAAHGKRETGKAEKPSDVWTTPLCPAHHADGPQAQHRLGERAFWFELLKIDPFALCVELEIAFREGRAAFAVIADHAARGRKTRESRP